MRLHPEPTTLNPEIEARALRLRELAVEALQLLPQVPAELANAIRNIESIPALVDLIASFLDLKPIEKQQVLATFGLRERLDLVLEFLRQRVEVLRISHQIDERTRAAFDERQKEAVLRERLRQIRKELGEDDEGDDEIAQLKAQLAKAGMPSEIEEHVRVQIGRLERMGEASAEYSMTRSYLEWMLALPWSKLDQEQIDIEGARRILDEDHFGLENIKRRIVEFLAVRKLNPEGHSPILCFVGPPGVGKTSLGQSIARAVGLKFVRVSLGGVHDEAEIRGHRRTYVGAMPGNIIQALRKAGTRNPVMMLDEVDKVSASFQGDPSSALLEVLDPEQNHTFRDNYLGVPFDLSKVLFIGTANVLDTMPPPLRDRMEIIQLTGLHAGGEARDRQALPVAAAAAGERSDAAAGAAHRRGDTRHHQRLHARGRRAQPRARDRCGAAPLRGADRVRPGRVRSACRRRIYRASSVAPRFENEVAIAHQRAGRGHRTGLDAGGRGHSVRREQPRSRQRQADPHRAARRGDEGECAGGRDAGQGACGAAGHRHRRYSKNPICTSTCRPAPSPRTVPARAWRSSPRWCRC